MKVYLTLTRDRFRNCEPKEYYLCLHYGSPKIRDARASTSLASSCVPVDMNFMPFTPSLKISVKTSRIHLQTLAKAQCDDSRDIISVTKYFVKILRTRFRIDGELCTCFQSEAWKAKLEDLISCSLQLLLESAEEKVPCYENPS